MSDGHLVGVAARADAASATTVSTVSVYAAPISDPTSWALIADMTLDHPLQGGRVSALCTDTDVFVATGPLEPTVMLVLHDMQSTPKAEPIPVGGTISFTESGTGTLLLTANDDSSTYVWRYDAGSGWALLITTDRPTVYEPMVAEIGDDLMDIGPSAAYTPASRSSLVVRLGDAPSNDGA